MHLTDDFIDDEFIIKFNEMPNKMHLTNVFIDELAIA